MYELSVPLENINPHIVVTDYTRQQNLTFVLVHEGKYQILIELLTLNSNM